jgi:nicotinate-nucleotide--dimethylbenzimidazole phosphoribosyltransferase
MHISVIGELVPKENKTGRILMTITSLNDLRSQLSRLPGPDLDARTKAEAREPQLTKPPGSLGQMEEISAWVSTWQGAHPPRMAAPRARVFAGNHGVVSKGVSAYPAEVTQQMVFGFQAGSAAVNQICKTFDVELQIVPLDLDTPTHDFTEQPALSEQDFVAAFNSGANAVPEQTDMICLGEMGIGNTTSAAAICLALYGGNANDWTGAGTGVTGTTLENKASVVAAGVAHHKPDCEDSLDTLCCLGGRELVAIAGAIVKARQSQIPVMIDGFIATAAAACLERAQEGALDHCNIAHSSAEKGHEKLLQLINKQALLDLGMRLGEASGAALAASIVKAAVNCHNGMATFAEAGVTNK